MPTEARLPRAVCASLSLALLSPACTAEEPAPPASTPEETAEADSALNASAPEVPALSRDVSMIEGLLYKYPTTPAFRTTADGRVSLNLKGPSRFRALRPEALAAPFATLPAGAPMVETAGATPDDIQIEAHDDAIGTGSIQHRTICDGSGANGVTKSPQPCGTGSASDCYDLTVLAMVPFTETATGKKKVEVWSTPVRVQVNNPKTAAATVRAPWSPAIRSRACPA